MFSGISSKLPSNCCLMLRFMSTLGQERKPELNAEIMAFRDYLLSSTVSDTLEVWELKGNNTNSSEVSDYFRII